MTEIYFLLFSAVLLGISYYFLYQNTQFILKIPKFFIYLLLMTYLSLSTISFMFLGDPATGKLSIFDILPALSGTLLLFCAMKIISLR